MAEFSVVRTEARPSGVRFGRLRPWQWSVTWYWATEGDHAGVYDRRVHLYEDGGWCPTWWLAAIAAGRYRWRRRVVDREMTGGGA